MQKGAMRLGVEGLECRDNPSGGSFWDEWRSDWKCRRCGGWRRRGRCGLRRRGCRTGWTASRGRCRHRCRRG
ncbi:unnamed protein product [Tuwongella immobilis]|uniref:Uncharacterized protein n=1 Tax=Tuwongella immobilis TaxID=692036 RepID=A0A6C2YSM5_9BACT|nr:unnamed protein product [Tuwongella immobilis]VTS06090.1 unnamed protein product [Tuwongella immobilis]